MVAMASVARGEPTSEESEFFEKQIRPVLVEHCYECHSGKSKRLEAGLRLDSRAAVLAGGDSGPAIVPGKPDESLLVEAIRYESFEMPPRGRLPDEAVQLLVKWTEMGAPWPDQPDSGEVVREAMDWRRRKAEHWSWQPIRKCDPPAVNDGAWPAGEIDRFILARLEEKNLTPAPQADRRTLIRRAYFDLIGLPPTTEQVEAFAADDSPEAYDRIVDQLLDSDHFGEKWARHWMDLVRYAETHGHEFDYPIHHAWRYRDYLIRAFNADVAYDQLITEHLAGDLLENPRRHPTEGFNESIIGTGFWFLGEAVHAPTDVRGDEAIRIDNQIDVMTKTFLGLTVGCARCHDHKFDPIPTEDYYALTGFLQSSRRQEAMLDPHGRIAAAADSLRELRRAGDAALSEAIDRSAVDAGRFASGLLAAREAIARSSGGDEAMPSGEVLREVGSRHGMDGESVGRWVAALRDPAIRESAHPLFGWSRLADGAASADESEFAAARDRLAAELTRQTQQVEANNAPTVLFEDFETGIPNGWNATGEAFAAVPTTARQWDSASRTDQPVQPGLVHGGLASSRLHGVLRSPTFTITHPAIHYRLNAKNVTIRLVIDGYFMVMFHGLLFGGVELKNVDTEGRFAWKTQGGDLSHYIGHRAHLEIIDQGDGFAALDEIRFSDGPVPRDAPSRLACGAVGGGVDSIASLARSYGATWSECVDRWRDGSADREDVALLAWAVQHRLAIPRVDVTAEFSQRMAEIEAELPAPTHALAMTDGTGEDDRVHIRGSHKNFGGTVPRRLLLALGGEDQPLIREGSGRLELARRITDPSNPFPSRVMVNRLWHHLFGRGIVPSVDDFGVMGQPPTHPELLDWLAADFQGNGWSIKHTIRKIVTSSTYRMSSKPGSDGGRGEQIDPNNELLHRMPKRRLQAEAIRDAMLAVSGRLDLTMYGPSVPVHLTSFMEGRGRPGSGPLDGNGRRSVYIEVRRNFLSPMMLTFDMPSPFNTMGRRSVSNVPAQSLILMNDPFVISQARLWAERMLGEFSSTDERISAMFLAALAQPPTESQLDRARQFLDEQARLAGTAPDDVRVWADLAHMLLNMKEFVYLN